MDGVLGLSVLVGWVVLIVEEGVFSEGDRVMDGDADGNALAECEPLAVGVAVIGRSRDGVGGDKVAVGRDDEAELELLSSGDVVGSIVADAVLGDDVLEGVCSFVGVGA